MSSETRGDRLARCVGGAVFLCGLAVIAGVLCLAYGLYLDPGIPAAPSASAASPTLTDLGVGFGHLIVRIALLFLGSLCGWFIAGRGIGLYQAGARHGGGAA